MSTSFRYGADRLTAKIALELSRGELMGVLSSEVRDRIGWAQQQVAQIAAGESACYGVNTGFGPLCATIIPKEHRASLQEKLLKSHSVGLGESIAPLLSRLMLVQKIHALSLGHSGVSLALIERLMWLVEQGYAPVVPSQGSVGASGDLAPLSHLFLPLIGEGYLQMGFGESSQADGKIASADVWRKHNLEPLTLGPKAGLALINGTQFIAAHAVQVVDRLERAINNANLIGAMMLDGLQGSVSPLDARLHALRPHPGAIHVASAISNHLSDSSIPAAHAACDRVQDPYSLRCMPQVHGASHDAWNHLREVLEIELNSVTDNPVIVGAAEVISGGSFHGQPLAMPLDYATLAASELGSIAERRIYLSLLGIHPNVPKLLMKEAGLNSGFMIVQYAAAALASENKTLCFPASADSIPTGLGQEDHVSMGSISGRKCLRVIDNLERIQAIELFCAAQALDFQRPLRSGASVEGLHAKVRESVSHASEDRIFSVDIERCLDVLLEKD